MSLCAITKNRKSAVPMLYAGAAVCLCLCGCATSVETPLGRPWACSDPQPLHVAVLPPRIHADLSPERFRGDTSLFKLLLMDGRGVAVTSADADREIALKIVSTLTQAGVYERVFMVEDLQEAEQLGADCLLAVTVYDYRTVLLGANSSVFWALPLGPLMPQYWIRWRTLEARFDWEVHLASLETGETLYRERLQRGYTSPVRSAWGDHFINKMVSFLRDRATPNFVGEVFSLRMMMYPSTRGR